MNKQAGFTLIEIMITVVIVAILAAIASASYTAQVQKSRRSCGTGALLEMAALQEQRFFQFNAYQGDVVNLYGANVCPEEFYTLSVATTRAGGTCADNSCYTLTATARGPQLGDEQCRVLTLDNLGVRTASSADNGNGRAVTTDVCW